MGNCKSSSSSPFLRILHGHDDDVAFPGKEKEKNDFPFQRSWKGFPFSSFLCCRNWSYNCITEGGSPFLKKVISFLLPECTNLTVSRNLHCFVEVAKSSPHRHFHKTTCLALSSHSFFYLKVRAIVSHFCGKPPSENCHHRRRLVASVFLGAGFLPRHPPPP